MPDIESSEAKKKSALKALYSEEAIAHQRITTKDMPFIDWSEKNFPPCCAFINFNLPELPGRCKVFCQRAYWGFVTCF